jgi:hypothetical protein
MDSTQHKPVIVLAGSRQQYVAWIHNQKVSVYDFVYCFDQAAIQSVEAKDVECVGTFWERSDARELYQLALTRIR